MQAPDPEPPSSPVIRWASTSHSGSRKARNDDSLLNFSSSPRGAEVLPPIGSRSVEKCDLVFAISDGMGGGNAGDFASSTLLKQMSKIVPETFKLAASGIFPDHLSHLCEAIRTIHEHINEKASTEETKGMAATLALAWFTPENLYLANVGDSRIYRSRGGELKQLSKDHTTAWSEWKRGVISEIQYRTHPRRAALYEVVGGGHQTICPHSAAIPFASGDRFLICSDGLIDGVWERHISCALAAQHNSPETVCEQLLKRAVENAGVDDITLTVIEIA